MFMHRANRGAILVGCVTALGAGFGGVMPNWAVKMSRSNPKKTFCREPGLQGPIFYA